MSIERECSCRDAAWSQGSSPTLLPTKRGRHVVNLKLGIKNSTQAGKARRQLEASIHIGHLKVVVSVTGCSLCYHGDIQCCVSQCCRRRGSPGTKSLDVCLGALFSKAALS